MPPIAGVVIFFRELVLLARPFGVPSFRGRAAFRGQQVYREPSRWLLSASGNTGATPCPLKFRGIKTIAGFEFARLVAATEPAHALIG